MITHLTSGKSKWKILLIFRRLNDVIIILKYHEIINYYMIIMVIPLKNVNF